MASRGDEHLLQAMKRLKQLSIGQLAKVLRSGRNRQVIQALDRLGPSGRLVKDVANIAIRRGDAKSLKALQAAIAGSDATILPPLDKRGQLPKGYTEEQAQQIAEQAAQWLEARGYRVRRPEEAAVEARERERKKREQLQQSSRGTVTLPLPDNNVPHEYSIHHPIVTREMIQVGSSSNVHSYGYDWRKRRLYVRFLAGQEGNRRGKGALYGYEQVPPKLFLDLIDAGSKGGWVWDHLRIRGTISGHQFDYALRGLGPSLYVPRKATLTAEGEAFVPRDFHSFRTNRVHSSSKPQQLVRPLRPGFPDRPSGGFRREW